MTAERPHDRMGNCWCGGIAHHQAGMSAPGFTPAASGPPLVEALALAMAAAEGNREAQERATGNNYDALGYGALAKAAVVELERLGVLAGTPTANAATGPVGAP